MRFRTTALALIVVMLSTVTAGAGGSLPSSSVVTSYFVVGDISWPTSMAFAPDGRLFVTTKSGTLLLLINGELKPALSLPVAADAEEGLLGLAFDPNFGDNHYAYLSYTPKSLAARLRVSRFTVSGDVVLPDSEKVLLEVPPSDSQHHLAGALHFGTDGKLYISVGDAEVRANAQALDNLSGKLLRMNPDGSVPADNPFVGRTTGKNQLIWAYGFRNPYTFAVDGRTGDILANDVGEVSWEEVDAVVRGGNYGWPAAEGPSTDPAYLAPLHTYSRDVGATVAGGTFYNPSVAPALPTTYLGRYFFADWQIGWIHVLDPADGAVTQFASGLANPVDLDVGPDGALYVLEMGLTSGSGDVRRYEAGVGAQALSAINLDDGSVAIAGRNAAGALFARLGKGSVFADWTHIGDGAVGRPALVVGETGLIVFTRGRHNQLEMFSEKSGQWSMTDLGGVITGDPVAARVGDAVVVVAADPLGNVVYRRVVGGAWSGWQDAGGSVTGDLHLVRRGDDLILLALGRGGSLFANQWLAGETGWAGWTRLGGPFVGAIAAANAGQDTHVVARTVAGTTFVFSLSGASWSAAIPLTADGNLDALDSDQLVTTDSMGHTFVQPLRGSDPKSATALGGNFRSGIAAITSGGIPYLFTIGLDSGPWYQREINSRWSGWIPLGGILATGE